MPPFAQRNLGWTPIGFGRPKTMNNIMHGREYATLK
jgi:hypothetical protein